MANTQFLIKCRVNGTLSQGLALKLNTKKITNKETQI